MLKVRDLIELLRDVNPDLVAVLQDDAEGNSYHLLEGVDDCDDNLAFIPESKEVAYKVLTEALKEDGYTPEDLAPTERIPCVVLFPKD